MFSITDNERLRDAYALLMYRSSASVPSISKMYFPRAPKTSSRVGALSRSFISYSLISQAVLLRKETSEMVPVYL